MINYDFYTDHAYFHSNIPDIVPNTMEGGVDTNSIQLEAETLINLEFLDQGEISEDMELLTGEEDSHLEGCSLSDLLIMGAEAVETENWFRASTVVTKLNALLSSQENGENSLGRLALYFTEGLIYKCLHSPELLEDSSLRIPSSAISAFQMLHELSPYVKFAHFTANQAIMEAMEDSPGVHVVDFDIMEGMQWPPLMVDLAARPNASLRITAIVTDQQRLGSLQQTRIRLHEFADSIKLPFSFHEMLMTKDGDFEGIEAGRETLIANCMLHQLHMPHRESSLLKTFLCGIKKRSPKIVILVEDDLFNMDRVQSMSFVEFFCEAIQHYAAVSDSIRTGFGGGYNLAVKIIEREFLRTRILDSVKQYTSFQTQPSLSGFRQIPLSSCNTAQAKFLLSLFNGSYWVQNDKFRLALCWKARTLTTVSILVPTSEENHQECSQFLI